MLLLNDVRALDEARQRLADATAQYLAAGKAISSLPISARSSGYESTTDKDGRDRLAQKIGSMRTSMRTWDQIANELNRPKIDCRRIWDAYMKRLENAD